MCEYPRARSPLLTKLSVSGLPLPDPADRAAHDEVGEWNASSEPFRMGQLKTKVRARVTKDTEEGAQDVDNSESSSPCNPTSLSPGDDLVVSQVIGQYLWYCTGCILREQLRS